MLVMSMGRRLTEMQLQLFFLLASVIVRHRPDGLAPLIDADVADAAGAMAGTLEAASRGVIADLQATSRVGEGLRRQLRDLLGELGAGGGAGFERDAADVLRGIEQSARHEISPPPDGAGAGDKAYLTLLGRVLPPPPEEREEQQGSSGIIIP